MAEKFTLGGQEAWFHDHGHWGGFFHTYDHLQVGGDLDRPRKIHVFVPRDYEFSGKSYPVIYMNDGDTSFFPGGAYHKTWNMAQILSRLYVTNRIGKVIVVAVCPLNRDYEYTHAPVWGKDWGGLDEYARYLAYNLKGFIDEHYRTIPEPEQTLILGASHGGLAAFYTAIKYPSQFRLVAALSPSFWVGLDSVIDFFFVTLSDFFCSLDTSSLFSLAGRTLSNSHQRLKIYLDWGLIRQGGHHNSFIEERATTRGKEMQSLLINSFGYRQNEDLFVVEDPLGQHTEESWSARLENVLEIFYGN
jgi:pimeloyl-ACP methyl ester carboxylesterase